MRELPVELNTQFFKTGDFNAPASSILARIDAKHLHYRKADGRNDDTLTVVGGVFDRNGNFVTGTQKIVDLKLRDQTLDKLPEGGHHREDQSGRGQRQTTSCVWWCAIPKAKSCRR